MNSHITNLYPSPNGTVSGQNLAVNTSAVQFAAFHTDTKYVMIDVQDNSVYVTFDGSTPSATNGHVLLKEKGLLVLSSASGKAAKFLQGTGAAVVQVSQFLD